MPDKQIVFEGGTRLRMAKETAPGAFFDALAEAIADRVIARMEAKETKKVMNLKDAGAYMNRPVSSVRTLVLNKDLPSIRTNKRIYVLQSDIDEFLERSREM